MDKETIKSLAIVIIPIVILYIFYAIIGIGCPIKYFTGISCAGCGMTRAWIHFLKGDFSGAFAFHPLFPVPAILLAVFVFGKRVSQKIKYVLLCAAAVLFVIVYLYRLFNPLDTIVTITPQTGFLYRHVLNIFYQGR